METEAEQRPQVEGRNIVSNNPDSDPDPHSNSSPNPNSDSSIYSKVMSPSRALAVPRLPPRRGSTHGDLRCVGEKANRRLHRRAGEQGDLSSHARLYASQVPCLHVHLPVDSPEPRQDRAAAVADRAGPVHRLHLPALQQAHRFKLCRASGRALRHLHMVLSHRRRSVAKTRL
ncbi:hypothetical protein VPH35_034671 [Triticum aestivum]